MKTRFVAKGLTVALLSILFISPMLASQPRPESASKNVRGEFEERYQAYREGVRQDFLELPHRSTVGPRAHKHLIEISKLGPAVLPFIIEKSRETNDFFLNLPLFIVTKKTFEKTEWPKDSPKDAKATAKMFIDWWEKSGPQTPQRFEQRYVELRVLREQHKKDETQEKYRQIRRLGIAALPSIMEKVKLGDIELIPIISELTDGKIKKDITQSECLDWWEKNKQEWLIPFEENSTIEENSTVHDPNNK